MSLRGVEDWRLLETELHTFAVIPISFEAGPTAKSEHSYISPSQVLERNYG